MEKYVPYFKKLQDRRWQEKKDLIFRRDRYTCQKCMDKEDKSILQCHHKYYEHRKDPWDYPDEAFITLCIPCHKAAEVINADFDRTLKTLFDSEQMLELVDFFDNASLHPGMLLRAIRQLSNPEVIAAALESHLQNHPDDEMAGEIGFYVECYRRDLEWDITHSLA
jgi:hypothetical protein